MKSQLHIILLIEGFPTVWEAHLNFPKKISFDFIEFS
jgi:L-ribulose-5-phosphate 3-epimerase UlaE